MRPVEEVEYIMLPAVKCPMAIIKTSAISPKSYLHLISYKHSKSIMNP